jgi:hypothetical protein
VLPGEWVIAEPNAPGRFYPCADAVFRARYNVAPAGDHDDAGATR